MKPTLVAALATACVLVTAPAFAAVYTTGGIDPAVGLSNLAPWFFSLLGIIIPIICGAKGAHAVAEGRHFAPYAFSAVAGSALAFGGAYIMTNYGLT